MEGRHPEYLRADIRSKGKTLARLAHDAGVSESAVRMALRFGCPAGERVIAEFLNKDPRELWPDRYRDPTPARARILNAYLSRPRPAGHRQKRKVA